MDLCEVETLLKTLGLTYAADFATAHDQETVQFVLNQGSGGKWHLVLFQNMERWGQQVDLFYDNKYSIVLLLKPDGGVRVMSSPLRYTDRLLSGKDTARNGGQVIALLLWILKENLGEQDIVFVNHENDMTAVMLSDKNSQYRAVLISPTNEITAAS